MFFSIIIFDDNDDDQRCRLCLKNRRLSEKVRNEINTILELRKRKNLFRNNIIEL